MYKLTVPLDEIKAFIDQTIFIQSLSIYIRKYHIKAADEFNIMENDFLVLSLLFIVSSLANEIKISIKRSFLDIETNNKQCYIYIIWENRVRI